MNAVLLNTDVLAAPATTPPAFRRAEAEAMPVVSLTTLVVWLTCLTVGVFGFVVPYLRPRAAQPQPAALEAQMLNIDLSDAPDQSPVSADAATATTAMAVPQTPPALAVAEPSPSIAFAIAVKNFSQVTDVRHAGYARNQNENLAVAAAPVQRITFGRGEGKQPAPEYPVRARREGQQGTVVVRLTVAENGCVLAAEAVSPSPWPLLNESAVRTVKTRWNFAAGKLRVYEVPIAFELTL